MEWKCADFLSLEQSQSWLLLESRSERSTGRSGACQQPSNLTCWQQDGGAAPRKIREGGMICLEKWDFSAAPSTDALAGGSRMDRTSPGACVRKKCIPEGKGRVQLHHHD